MGFGWRALRTVWPGLLVLVSTAAFAAEPLLVVVELGADSRVTPDEVRGVVAKEIDGPVASPSDQGLTGNSETLIIEIKTNQASLAFQPREGMLRRRWIVLPEDNKDRLRAIAWVSVNLVRDQDTGLLGESADAPINTPASPPSSGKGKVNAQTDQRTTVPPTPAKKIEPETGPTLAAAIPKSSELSPDLSSTWSLSAFGGPTLHFLVDTGTTSTLYRSGLEWQLEAQRSLWDWTVGVALDLGPDDQPVAALAGFLGDGWHKGRLRIDATAGLGLELAKRQVRNCTVVDSTQNGISSYCEIQTELRPRLFGRANLTLAWAVRHTLDVTLRASLHMETDHLLYGYGSALLGLRMNLP